MVCSQGLVAEISSTGRMNAQPSTCDFRFAASQYFHTLYIECFLVYSKALTQIFRRKPISVMRVLAINRPRARPIRAARGRPWHAV